VPLSLLSYITNCYDYDSTFVLLFRLLVTVVQLAHGGTLAEIVQMY